MQKQVVPVLSRVEPAACHVGNPLAARDRLERNYITLRIVDRPEIICDALAAAVGLAWQCETPQLAILVRAPRNPENHHIVAIAARGPETICCGQRKNAFFAAVGQKSVQHSLAFLALPLAHFVDGAVATPETPMETEQHRTV